MRLRERFLRPSFSTGVASSFCALLTWVNIPPALLGQSASSSVIPAGALICWSLIGGCILQGARLPELAEMGLAHWILLGSWWIFLWVGHGLFGPCCRQALWLVYVCTCTCIFPHAPTTHLGIVGMSGVLAWVRVHTCLVAQSLTFRMRVGIRVWVYVPYFVPFAHSAAF